MKEIESGRESAGQGTERDKERKRYYVPESGIPQSLTNSSDEDDFDKTETEESSSTMTEEQIHRRKVQHNFDIAADVLKVGIIIAVHIKHDLKDRDFSVFPLVGSGVGPNNRPRIPPEIFFFDSGH